MDEPVKRKRGRPKGSKNKPKVGGKRSRSSLARQSVPKGTVSRPKDWEKVVSAAYMRSLGQTQTDSEDIAGIGRGTLKTWEASPWWSEALKEANDKWLGNVVALAKSVAMDVMTNGSAGWKEQAQMARFMLERLEPATRPPTMRSELAGPDGGPVQIAYGMSDADLETAAAGALERVQAGKQTDK